MEEKRKVERFKLDVESRIRRHDRTADNEVRTHFSADISSAGIFLLTDSPLPAGTGVDVAMSVQHDMLGLGTTKKMTLKASGRVIRTNDLGMAVSFDKKSHLAEGQGV